MIWYHFSDDDLAKKLLAEKRQNRKYPTFKLCAVREIEIKYTFFRIDFCFLTLLVNTYVWKLWLPKYLKWILFSFLSVGNR